MNDKNLRVLYAVLITGSVIITPIVGFFGPFDNGNQSNSLAREYFLPADYVFFTIWNINYLGLAVYGIWQALPAQRKNQRLQSALPWLAATSIGNVFWILLAGSPSTVPWTVPVLLFMEVTAWMAYFRLGIPSRQAASTTEIWLQAAFRVYIGWLSVATIANTGSALIVLGWDGWGIAPQTWAAMMLLVATGVAWIVGRLAGDDNIYRAVFVYAFIGIIIQQRDVAAIVWAAAIGAIAVAAMIAATWRRRTRQLTPAV